MSGFDLRQAQEDAIIEVLRMRWSHVSAERVLSGAGLVNLYEALCTIDGSAARATAHRSKAGLVLTK